MQRRIQAPVSYQQTGGGRKQIENFLDMLGKAGWLPC